MTTKAQPTIAELLLVFVERYHADRKAQQGFVEERARTLATVTLDAYMRNVATELHQRFGLSLEAIPATTEG